MIPGPLSAAAAMAGLLLTLLPAASRAADAPSVAGQVAPRANVCGPGARPQRSADVAAICESGRRWIAAFEAGDIDGLMRLYTADAQVALHGQPRLEGLAAIRAFFTPVLAARPKVEFLLDVEDIQVRGDFAWLVSGYWYTSDSGDGKPYRDAGRSLLIYQRDRNTAAPDEWKIRLDIDQATPDIVFPPPPGAR